MGGKRLKRGEQGKAACFINQAQCLKKLQLKLPDFRRLCILKGIYPRIPSAKVKDKHQTYYHAKDMSFLSHEPLIEKYREERIRQKRIKRALGRREESIARHITQYKKENPVTLHHLIKERYPSLVEALKDFDDCISTLALFAVLPANTEHRIQAASTAEAETILSYFYALLVKEECVKCVFVSIKGFYVRATILGQDITWLIPHAFTHTLPTQVDYRVMNTFLEFYLTLAKFTTFKLFEMAAYSYPPSNQHESLGRRFVYFNVEHRPEGNPKTPLLNAPKDANEERSKQRVSSLFSSLTVFVSREVPLTPVALVVLSCGGNLGWEDSGSPISANDPVVTHQIVDRPLIHIKKPECQETGKPLPREYVQPQWIFDSLNNGVLLPVDDYKPDAKLPAHLSPFVNDAEAGYMPLQREKLNAIIQEMKEPGKNKKEGGLLSSDAETSSSEDEDDVGELISTHQADLLEEAGIPQQPKAELVKAKRRKKEEEKAQRRALLSKKHKRLLEKIEFAKKRKEDSGKELLKKRKKLEPK